MANKNFPRPDTMGAAPLAVPVAASKAGVPPTLAAAGNTSSAGHTFEPIKHPGRGLGGKVPGMRNGGVVKGRGKC